MICVYGKCVQPAAAYRKLRTVPNRRPERAPTFSRAHRKERRRSSGLNHRTNREFSGYQRHTTRVRERNGVFDEEGEGGGGIEASLLYLCTLRDGGRFIRSVGRRAEGQLASSWQGPQTASGNFCLFFKETLPSYLLARWSEQSRS
jgi:hypothetical protein